MSDNKKIFVFPIVLLLSTMMVFAASDASELYQKFSSYASEGAVAEAIDTYSDLQQRIGKETDTAKKSVEKAYKKNNWELYREAVTDLRTLSGYSITKDQTNALLSSILNEDSSKAIADASWLYENSRYYRPVLKLSYSSSNEGYSFNYSNSVSVKPGLSVMLPSQEDLNFNTNRLGRLVGWGLVPGNVDYLPGQEISMPLTDMTLFAVWENAVTFKDDLSGIDVSTTDVKDGDTVSVPVVEKQNGSAIFAGWYDSGTGEYLGPEEETYSVRGNGASFQALYKALEVSDPTTAPYDSVPSNAQVPLGFTIRNTANESIAGIKIEISSSSDKVSIIDDSYYVSRLNPDSSATVKGARIVVSGAVSGEDLPFLVTMTDSDGDVWTSTFSLKAK